MTSILHKISSSVRKWTKSEDSESVILVELKDLGVHNGTNSVSEQQPSSAEGAYLLHRHTYFYTVVFFTVLGGLLFGYDTGVIAGALLALNDDFEYDLSAIQQEMIVAVTVAAAIVGAVGGALTNEWLGRRPSIIIASAIYIIGSVVMSSAPIDTHGWLVVLTGRLIVGIGIGLSSMTVPMYLAECSPAHQRGSITMVDIMAVTGGQFIAATIDYAFSFVPQGWRYMLGLAAIPALIRMIAFFFLPESPRWLVGKGKVNKAREVLQKLKGRDDVEKDLEEITKNLENTAAENEKNVFQKLWYMLRHKHLLIALIVGCGLQAIQQLSGVNTIVYYSPTILRMAGAVDNHLAIGLSAVVALTNLVFTLIGLWLVERVGRRRLILVSLAGVIFSLILLGGGFIYTHTSSQPSCPTDECSWRDCEECVLEDNCFFCNFPSSADYGETGTGFCIHRNWTEVDDDTDEDYCWVPEVALVPDVDSDDHCSNLSYVTPGYGPPSPSSIEPTGQPTGSASGSGMTAAPPPDDDYLRLRGAIFPFCPSRFLWVVLVALIFYSMAFAPGMRPVPWTVNAEIYPNWARSVGNSASTATNWVCNLLVSVTFLHLTHVLNPFGTFFLYTLLAIAGFVFILLMLPETKGKSLEEVEDIFLKPVCPPIGFADDSKPLYETLDN